MRKIITICFLLTGVLVNAQTVLTVEGQAFTSPYLTAHPTPTVFTFRNNSITANLSEHYMLVAGDETPASTNNNLNEAIITGNRFTGLGTATNTSTHSLFVGYNINDYIRYNYINNSYYGVVTKSGNSGASMTWTTGGIAYNIIKDCVVGVIVRGINGIKIYNNTFYNSFLPYPVSTGALIYIQENESASNAPSTGTKIFNNIFYTKHQIINIYIEDASCVTGFESDYNVFYCETGTPQFSYNGRLLTFEQWKAIGYDTHSVVINPNLNNTTDLLPASRLNYGTNLGTAWQTGLSKSASWTIGTPPATMNQNGTWQAGAHIYEASLTTVTYVGSVIENAAPTSLVMTYDATLANIVPPASAFQVMVNFTARAVTAVTISGTQVLLTLSSRVAYGDVITVSYTKPATNPLQTTTTIQAPSLSAQSVRNNTIQPVNQSPTVTISSPISGNEFTSPATINIVANANDPDGSISKVEFFNGTVKIGEKTVAPYSYLWNDVAVGTFLLTAVATDNQNAKTVSSVVSVTVNSAPPVANKFPVIIIITPNDGKEYIAPATINITVEASDQDGSISKIEYFNGDTKIGESITSPFSFSFESPIGGIYELSAIATDNLNASASSNLVNVYVNTSDDNKELINLFPNPNNGQFSVDLVTSQETENRIITIADLSGKAVYNGSLSNEEATKKFDMSGLDAGIYILIIKSEEIIATKKFIKN